jgi:2-polyprenyl-3-methyl-5-hydroxy-6-metoxy-1,4-benzoquinol methylase
MSTLHRLLLRYLPERCRVLEIGCGSGRDAAFLLSHGYDVTATDASPAMLTLAAQHHPELASRLHQLSFPSSTTHNCAPFAPPNNQQPITNNPADGGAPYNAILSVAMVMHLTDAELRECAAQWRDLVEDEGVLVISASTDRKGLVQLREDTGRLYCERTPEELLAMFKQAGFTCIATHPLADLLKRDIQWTVLILRASPGRRG